MISSPLRPPRPKFPSYVDAVLRHAIHDPYKAAIGTEAGVLSFGQLAEAVAIASIRCSLAGIGPRAIVGLFIHDPVWHVCMVCALHKIGAVSISINANEIGLNLGFDAVLLDRDLPDKSLVATHRVEPDWFSETRGVSMPPAFNFAPTDLCRVALSSGTTGVPKAFAMSPEVLWHRFTTYNLRGRFGVSEKVLCGPQLCSHFAFAIVFGALIAGKTVCFATSAGHTLPIVSYFGVDLAVISVHQLGELAEAQVQQFGGLSSLREIQAGGSLISGPLLRKVRSVIACPILNTYASTEAGAVALADVGALGEFREQGAVGYLTPWADVTVCDDDGTELQAGEPGNLRVSAVGMAAPYRKGMTNVVEPMSFFPGDYGRVTPNRLLFIGGRTTEVINLGGNKVAPESIEQIILECPGVQDAAVFAVDVNAEFPQIWAVVVAGPNFDPKIVIQRCAERSRVTIPTVIKTVASIPRNTTGKILRDQLRRQLTGESA